MEEISLDENSYVMATLPANTDENPDYRFYRSFGYESGYVG